LRGSGQIPRHGGQTNSQPGTTRHGLSFLPVCNTEAMDLHLAEIAKDVAPGRYAVLLLDQAGWHMSNKLIVPPHITLVPLPPKCREIKPDRKRPAVHARQPAIAPRLPILRQPARPLLQIPEQARRSALTHHLGRTARLGARVLIRESWYYNFVQLHSKLCVTAAMAAGLRDRLWEFRISRRFRKRAEGRRARSHKKTRRGKP